MDLRNRTNGRIVEGPDIRYNPTNRCYVSRLDESDRLVTFKCSDGWEEDRLERLFQLVSKFKWTDRFNYAYKAVVDMMYKRYFYKKKACHEDKK